MMAFETDSPAVRAANVQFIRVVANRRRRRRYPRGEDAFGDAVPAPRPPSPVAVIYAEHNAELAGANPDVQG